MHHHNKFYIDKDYPIRIMRQHLLYLRENFNKGVRGFSEHLIRYTPSAVKDYWDLGAMITAGFAFNDNGSEVFGDARVPVMIISGLAGLNGAGADMNRGYRNLYAGFASLCAFWTRGIDSTLSIEIGNYVVSALLAVGSFDMDRQRRRGITGHYKDPLPENLTKPLEDIVQ